MIFEKMAFVLFFGVLILVSCGAERWGYEQSERKSGVGVLPVSKKFFTAIRKPRSDEPKFTGDKITSRFLGAIRSITVLCGNRQAK